jgi:hypothetical protein
MSSDTSRGKKTIPLKPPYVIVSDYHDKSGMDAVVMFEAEVELQPDGKMVIKGIPGYVSNLDVAVTTVKVFKGEIVPK